VNPIGFLVGKECWSNVTETRGSTADWTPTQRLDTVTSSRLSREMTASWTSETIDNLTSANRYSYTSWTPSGVRRISHTVNIA